MSNLGKLICILLLVASCARAPTPEPAPVESSCSRGHAIELAAGAVAIVKKQGNTDGAFSFAVAMIVTMKALDIFTATDVDGFRELLSEAMSEYRKKAGMTL